jgi:hypothetical protein
MNFKEYYFTEELEQGIQMSTHGWPEYSEVYKNPNEFEIDTIYKDMNKQSNETGKLNSIRLSVDEGGNLYAWRGDLLHHFVLKRLKKPTVLTLVMWFDNDNLILFRDGDPRWDGSSLSSNAINKLKNQLKLAFGNYEIDDKEVKKLLQGE